MSTATATEIASLGINQIIVNSLNSAFRTLLTKCAENVNTNFDKLKQMNPQERFEAIVMMFGLEEEDAVKIIKPAPKKTADGTTPKKTGKTKAEKTLPLPFWGEKTVNRQKCQGLQATLYNQCAKSCVDGSIYCKKCKEEADKNDHGMPNRGNIESRLEQFNDDYYDYTTPDDKCRHVYIGTWAAKKELSEDQVVDIFTKNGIVLTDDDKSTMFFVPPKKKSAKSKKGLTEDMEKRPKGNKKGRPTPGRPSPKKQAPLDDADDAQDNDDAEDDDTQSVCSEMTDATEATEVPEDEDEDEDDIEIPDPEPELNLDDFTTFGKGDKRFAVLKEQYAQYKKDINTCIPIYKIADYDEADKTFSIVGSNPVGELCNKLVKIFS
jgi:hypothetical protein